MLLALELHDARMDAREEGLAEGRAVGLEQGREEGLAEGREQGLAEGRAVGIAEGRAEGRAEGETKKLVLLIERRMHKTGMSCEEVMEDLDCTPEERSQYYAYVASKKE